MPPPSPGAQGHRRVFVEIGVSHEPGLPERPPRESSAKGWTVTHLLATEGQPTAIPWRLDEGEVDKGAVGTMTVLPHLVGVAPGYVRLELALTDAAPAGSPAVASNVLETSLVLRDQQSITVKTEANPATSSRTLVVTPYVLHSDADLRRLLQCKQAARGDVAGTP